MQLKKTDYNAKINEIKNKSTTDHDKCITTREFNKLQSEHFYARLKQENLACKTDIPDITDFVKNKLKKLNKVTSNKTRDVEFKIKLDDLEKKFKIISTKGLTADMIK